MNNKLQSYPEKLTFFEKLQLYLFDEEDKIPSYHAFSEQELKIKKRYANVFAYWIDKPTLSDKKIVQYIMSEFGIKKTQAYRDVNNIKILLGNVRNAAKEWQRYKLIAMLDKAYEIAERRKDVKAMILAADKLGKYTQLDKEDTMKIPFDEIVPPSWEITGDVTVLGIKPIPNLEEKKKQLREKYGGTLIEEAEVIDEH